MAPPIRTTKFVPEWIDMGPNIPVPRIDWIARKRLDIAYGADPLQRYDLYYPDTSLAEPLPTVVIVHGGGFSHMDKRDWHLYPGFFALQAGFALISINYRLAPRHKFPDGQNDVMAALEHIKAHATDYGIDPDGLCLYGTSAGGNLVSIVGLKGHNESASYEVCAVAALCPFLSFRWADEGAPTSLYQRIMYPYMCRTYLGGWVRQVRDRYDQASAETYIGATAPPFYLQTGTKDPAIDYRDVVRFHDLLAKCEGSTPDRLVLDLLDGAPHAGAGPQYLEPASINPILDFFKRATGHQS